MAVRLVVNIQAKPGKGNELLQEYEKVCIGIREEPGCQQLEIFQSAFDPDRLCLLELWDDQAALDAHAALGASRPPNQSLADLRVDKGAREDYEYNRTR